MRIWLASAHAISASALSICASLRTSSMGEGSAPSSIMARSTHRRPQRRGDGPAQPPTERGAQEAVGALDGGRGSGTVTAMARSAASIRSTAKSPCPGPTSTTRYSAGSARRPASQRILRPARSARPGLTASCAAGSSDRPGMDVAARARARSRRAPSASCPARRSPPAGRSASAGWSPPRRRRPARRSCRAARSTRRG